MTSNDTNEEVEIPKVPAALPKIKVSTLNLLCNRDIDYIDEVASEIAKLSVDVISIQGCTKLNNEVLFRAFKSRGYLYTRFDQMHTRESGEIMFYTSRLLVQKKEYTNFSSSNQKRGVSKYRIALTKDPLSPEVWVITSHLEEGGSGNGCRKSQISEISSMFSSSTLPVIFAGDTSIPSWQDLSCPNGWFDAWREKGTSDNDKTSLLDRMDQIWYRSSEKSQMRCLDYDLICNSNPDRKGVVATFEISSM